MAGAGRGDAWDGARFGEDGRPRAVDRAQDPRPPPARAAQGAAIQGVDRSGLHGEDLRSHRVVYGSAGPEIHAIVDNDFAHKHSAVADWLADRRRWTLHFAPTFCSWTDAVEGFFGKLARRRLRRGVHDSLEDLEAAIEEFIVLHNEKEAKSFKWTAARTD